MAIKIMIADDHSMIREGLKSLLELEGDIQVVAEAEDGVDCLEKLKICTPDVLLLDINMPRKNGLEVLQTLKSSKSKVKVLVLTVHNEVEYLMKAVDIGVDGYILKDSESAELKKAIFSIVEGENYIQPSLIPSLNSKMIEKNRDEGKIESLTKRELEVLKLLAVGTPASCITSLAKFLLPSSWAAAFDGPNTLMPAARKRSAAPLTRGASGPITTNSIASDLANSVIARLSLISNS